MSTHKPVSDRSAWQPADMEADRSWAFSLNDAQVTDLENALKGVASKPFEEITRDDFPLPTMTDLLSDMGDEIRDGRGFTTLSGIPTHYDYPDLERIYWGMSTHLGIAVTQNAETGLIHYITDGELAPKDGARILGKPRPSKLHVDLSDVVGLFCVKQAPDNPLSIVASSMTVYNEILAQHPEYLDRLEEGYYWNRKGPHDTEKPHSEFKVPAWSAAEDVVSCRFHSGWISGGHKQAGEELTEEDAEIFKFIDEVSVANAFRFELNVGDIAFWNNYTTFHGRDGFAETDDESRKRVLLRLWLDMDNVRPFADEGRVRYGAVRHGQIGWTAAEVLSGRNQAPHTRRSDGAPVTA
jgi:hypothetical protein